jgi:hypothetical protein
LNSCGQPLFAQREAMSAGLKERPVAPDTLEAKSQIIDSLHHTPDAGLGDDESPAPDFRGKKSPQPAQAISHQRLEATFQLADAIGNLRLGFDDNLRRSARRWRAKVGNKIANREIDLMPHGGNHRLLDRTMARATRSSLNGHRSSIDPPPRSHDDDVYIRRAAQKSMPSMTCSEAPSSLNFSGKDENIRGVMASLQDRQDVPQSRALW